MMPPYEKLKTTFSYQARYFKLGTIDEETENVWFICHGYGQLADSFIKKFETLYTEKTCIIAPEGLSRFYLEGFAGKIGASWMTKEEREDDIHNYLTYLNTIYRHEIAIHKYKNLIINVLGFSQGAATASRWVTESDIHFDSLILWAGVFPPDLGLTLSRERLAGKEVYFIYGDKDPFVTPDRLREQEEIAEKVGINPRMIRFHGAHTIDETTLSMFI